MLLLLLLLLSTPQQYRPVLLKRPYIIVYSSAAAAAVNISVVYSKQASIGVYYIYINVWILLCFVIVARAHEAAPLLYSTLLYANPHVADLDNLPPDTPPPLQLPPISATAPRHARQQATPADDFCPDKNFSLANSGGSGGGSGGGSMRWWLAE